MVGVVNPLHPVPECPSTVGASKFRKFLKGLRVTLGRESGDPPRGACLSERFFLDQRDPLDKVGKAGVGEDQGSARCEEEPC